MGVSNDSLVTLGELLSQLSGSNEKELTSRVDQPKFGFRFLLKFRDGSIV